MGSAMGNDRTREYGYVGLMSGSTWPENRPSDTTGSPLNIIRDAAKERRGALSRRGGAEAVPGGAHRRRNPYPDNQTRQYTRINVRYTCTVKVDSSDRKTNIYTHKCQFFVVGPPLLLF